MEIANRPPGPDGTSPSGRRTGVLGTLYRKEWAAWRLRYRRHFKSAARALGFGFVAGFLFFMIWPAQEKRALALVAQALKDIPIQGPPLVLALTLFTHNARATALAMAAGAVPWLALPILDPLLNGAVIGLLVSIARHQRLDVPRLVVTQILPHGIIELAAVLYGASVGLYLSAALGRKVRAAWLGRRAGPADAPSLFEAEETGGRPGVPQEPPAGPPRETPGRDALRSFVLVVLPLLLVAAFIEAFITPHLR